MNIYKEYNILIVDDDVILLDSLNELIELLFNKAYTAENGKEALMVYEEHKDDIDVIVTDSNMPIMNGYEFIEELTSAYGEDLKILLLTGEKHLEDKIHENLAGAITKPFDIKDFFYFFDSVLKDIKHYKCKECVHWDTDTNSCSNKQALSFSIPRSNESTFGCTLNSNR